MVTHVTPYLTIWLDY